MTSSDPVSSFNGSADPLAAASFTQYFLIPAGGDMCDSGTMQVTYTPAGEMLIGVKKIHGLPESTSDTIAQ